MERPMYKKVLLPICGKNNGIRGLKAMERALTLCDGEFVLLHVTEPISQVVGGEARQELQAESNAKGLMALGPIVEKMEISNAHFHTRVEPGTIAETIVKVADEEKVDLIVMFTDGREDITDMILGTITERVVRDTDVDLLAVRH